MVTLADQLGPTPILFGLVVFLFFCFCRKAGAKGLENEATASPGRIPAQSWYLVSQPSMGGSGSGSTDSQFGLHTARGLTLFAWTLTLGPGCLLHTGSLGLPGLLILNPGHILNISHLPWPI